MGENCIITIIIIIIISRQQHMHACISLVSTTSVTQQTSDWCRTLTWQKIIDWPMDIEP